MKGNRINIFAVVLFCSISALFAIGCKKGGEANSGHFNNLKRYPYERAHVVYEYTGDVRGTEDIFISDFGRYEARYSKVEIFSKQGIKPSDNGAITRLADQYTFDLAQRTATHDHPPTLDSLYHLEGNAIPTPQEYFEFEMKRNFFHSAGSDIIAGKPATRWEQDNASLTIWMWNSFLLRKRASSESGTMDMVIKSIDSLWTVDTTKFSLPAGLTITETQH